MMNKIILAMFLALTPSALAQGGLSAYAGQCSYGGATVVTQGLKSTTQVVASYPGCTVTVYAHGTSNKLALAVDPQGDILPNPFTANADGSFFFYATGSSYPADVTISGAGIPQPHTFVSVAPNTTNVTNNVTVTGNALAFTPLNPANNLGDLASPSQALANLGAAKASDLAATTTTANSALTSAGAANTAASNANTAATSAGTAASAANTKATTALGLATSAVQPGTSPSFGAITATGSVSSQSLVSTLIQGATCLSATAGGQIQPGCIVAVGQQGALEAVGVGGALAPATSLMVTNALQFVPLNPANSLSDVTNKSQALTNLGAASAAALAATATTANNALGLATSAIQPNTAAVVSSAAITNVKNAPSLGTDGAGNIISVSSTNGVDSTARSAAATALSAALPPALAPVWTSTATFSQYGLAIGSDGTLYSSVTNNNANNDPTLDTNHTNWSPVVQGVYTQHGRGGSNWVPADRPDFISYNGNTCAGPLTSAYGVDSPNNTCVLRNALSWIADHPTATGSFYGLELPPGHFGLAPTSTDGPYTTLLQPRANISIRGAGSGATVLGAPATANSVLSYGTSATAVSSGRNDNGHDEALMSLTDFAIVGHGHASSGDLLAIFNTINVIVHNVVLADTAGTCVNLVGGAERETFTEGASAYCGISVNESGDTNEERYERWNVLSAGSDDTHYCYNSPVCQGGVLIASTTASPKPWAVNATASVHLQGYRNKWADSSMKGSLVQGCISTLAVNTLFSHNYCESAPYGGFPATIFSVEAGGKLPLSQTTAAMSASQLVIPVTGAHNQYVWTADPAAVGNVCCHAGNNVFYVFPLDYVPGSTAASAYQPAGGPAITKGTVETISLLAFAGDGNAYLQSRGSTAYQWPANSVIEMAPISGGYAEIVANHLNNTNTANLEPVGNPQGANPNGYLDPCSDTTLGPINTQGSTSNACYEYEAGYVVDGYAVPQPSVQSVPPWTLEMSGNEFLLAPNYPSAQATSDGQGFGKVSNNGSIRFSTTDDEVAHNYGYYNSPQILSGQLSTGYVNVEYMNWPGGFPDGEVTDQGAGILWYPAHKTFVGWVLDPSNNGQLAEERIGNALPTYSGASNTSSQPNSRLSFFNGGIAHDLYITNAWVNTWVITASGGFVVNIPFVSNSAAAFGSNVGIGGTLTVGGASTFQAPVTATSGLSTAFALVQAATTGVSATSFAGVFSQYQALNGVQTAEFYNNHTAGTIGGFTFFNQPVGTTATPLVHFGTGPVDPSTFAAPILSLNVIQSMISGLANGEFTLDGTTNTNLMQTWTAAVLLAQNTGVNQTIKLGPGVYSVTSTLLEPQNGTCVSLVGTSGATTGADILSSGSTLSAATGMTGAIVNVPSGAKADEGCTYKNLTINGNKLATNGLQLQWYRGATIDNVTVNDTTQEGIILGTPVTSTQSVHATLSHVTVSYSSASYTPATRPAYGIHIQVGAIDSTADDLTVRNALTAGFRNEGGGWKVSKMHGFGFPYACTTGPCSNSASTSTAANASYATNYVVEDAGAGGNSYTDTYVDSPAIAGFHLLANGVSIVGGHVQWPDQTTFAQANLANVEASVTGGIIMANVNCFGMASSAGYGLQAGAGVWISFQSSGSVPPPLSAISGLSGCGDYWQQKIIAPQTAFDSGSSNINAPNPGLSGGANPRMWASPVAGGGNYQAFTAQLYSGYTGDEFAGGFSGQPQNFNITKDGSVRSSGGFATSTIINTAATLSVTTANHVVLANATSAAQTVTLFSCFTKLADGQVPTGFELTFVKTDTSANTVTLQTVSSQTINYAGTAASTLVLSAAGKRTLVCGPDNNWYAW